MDEIEDGVLRTEVEKNQQFVKEYFAGSYYESSELDENYELGLLNSYNVMTEVKDMKIKAFNIIEEVIDQMSSLKRILEEKNPLELLRLYDDSYDRLNINIDFDSISESLKSYEEDFKEFYYYQKEELYNYNIFLEKLGEKRLYFLRELKKIVITRIQSEFEKQNIKSEDDIYSTGFDLSFEFDNKMPIKINQIWTSKMDDDYELKSIVHGLNLIKNTNEINFNVDWGVYESRSAKEFLLCSVDSDLDELLMKTAEFLIKNY